MDIKAYIQSGIIESYVLGLATDEEVAEVEAYRVKYVEIDEAILDFSTNLEKEALANAIEPPTDIKVKLLKAISDQNQSANPVVSLPKIEDEKLIPISSLHMLKYAAAASIILFVVSAAINFYLYDKYNKKDEEFQALLTERNSLFANNEAIKASYNQLASAPYMMTDPDMAMIKLEAVPGKGNNAAALFWNTKSKDVFLMPVKLPKPAEGKQYQLWALVDGKPVDAGILHPDCTGICKMKNIPKAQGFAITLEKQGGSASPDMQQMYVKGGA